MSGDAAFTELIQQDPDICDNCFRRTHERFERNYRLEPYQVDFGEWDVRPVQVSGIEIELPNGDTEVLGQPPDDIYGKGENLTSVPADMPAGGVIATCKCGFRWAPQEEVEEWKNRPLAKKRFFEYAERLKRRLEEAGVDFDEEAFDRFLDDKKSDPDEQFSDDTLYARAVGHASSVASVRS